MFTAIDYLKQYKNDIINLSENNKQKKFLNNIFTIWYINIEKNGLLPKKNIISNNAIKDLIYANKNLNLDFNLDEIIENSHIIFDKYNDIHENCVSNNYNYLPDIITEKQELHLEKLYIIKNNNMIGYEINRNKLIALYDFIGINNIHLSIPPIFNGIELFGSPLNTHNKLYCSPFKFEQNFNSLGSFFNYKFHKNGIYLCNPPFDDFLIDKMSDVLINNLKNTNFRITIIITIPVWDLKSQKKIKIKNYNMEFKGYEKLSRSVYLVQQDILDKYDYPYYNYYTEKKTPASYTHLIILSNNKNHHKKKVSISKIKTQWKSWSDLSN